MEIRFVTWGTYKESKKVLIALELKKENYKVNIYTFDESIANKEFQDKMLTVWTKGGDVEFPEGMVQIERPLSEDSLLPDDLRVEKTGKIRNLQNEWAYLLLTEKLVESIVEEIKDIKQKVFDSNVYIKDAFEQTKNIWEKILDHRRERNINNDKVDELKAEVNSIFDRLKELRNEENKKYGEQAEVIFTELKAKIGEAIENINKNNPAKELFEQLKELRNNVNKLTLRKPSREELHTYLDEAFDLLKNRRNSRESKVNDKRIHDLTEIISKLEKSLDFDKKDLDFNKRKTNDRNVNQLEAKLREAKIKMLEEKVESKEEKLLDVRNTLQEILDKQK